MTSQTKLRKMITDNLVSIGLNIIRTVLLVVLNDISVSNNVPTDLIL